MAEDPPHPDGITLGDMLPAWDRRHLAFFCAARCGHSVGMGVRRAARLAGGPEVRVWAFARRMRCAACGHLGATLIVQPDNRSDEARRREGLLPACVEE